MRQKEVFITAYLITRVIKSERSRVRGKEIIATVSERVLGHSGVISRRRSRHMLDHRSIHKYIERMERNEIDEGGHALTIHRVPLNGILLNRMRSLFPQIFLPEIDAVE